MADHDILTFTPHNGGQGVRVAVTTVASTPVGVPCPSLANIPGPLRVRVANLGNVAAYVTFSGTASLSSSMAILPGAVEVFGSPYTNTGGVTVSALTEVGTTTISVVAGVGS